MAKPAARITDPTECPVSGHGDNPIASGSPDVIFEGLSAAREGDSTACGSALSSALSTTVSINGKRAAIVGSMGDHGNTVVSGASTIIIGDTFTPAPFVPPTPVAIGFAKTFLVTDSESGAPLAMREYQAIVNGKVIEGRTNSQGLAHIKTQGPNDAISIHVKFTSPTRLLHELVEAN